MHINYETEGVCARVIEYDINDSKVSNIKFHGGCPGNLKMISKILNNWDIDDIIKMCRNNTCGDKNTSCADQLAKSLEELKIKS